MSNLKTGPSGLQVIGQAQNDVLLWDVPTQKWVPGLSSGATALTRLLYVDRGSLATGAETGGIGSPFKTLGAAIAALGAGGGTLLVVPGDYSAETPPAIDLTAAVLIANIAAVQGFPIGAPIVTLPPLTTSGASLLSLNGVNTSTIAMGVGGQVQFDGSTLIGDLTGAVLLAAQNSVIIGEFTADTADFFHCFFGGSGNLGTAEFSIDCEQCSFLSGAITFTFAPTPGALHLDDFSANAFVGAPGSIINGVFVFESAAVPFQQWSGATAGNSAATLFFQATGAPSALSANENATQIVMTRTGTLRNLAARNSTAGAQNVTFTIRLNGVNTGITITIPAGSVATFFDNVNTARYAKGDLLSLSSLTAAPDATGVNSHISCEY